MTRPDALAAFLAKKTEIDAMLARLQGLSENHFGADPEALTWGDVGGLERMAASLREICACHEGEYAD